MPVIYDRHAVVALGVSVTFIAPIMILKGLCHPVVVNGAGLQTCGGGRGGGDKIEWVWACVSRYDSMQVACLVVERIARVT